MAVSVILVAIYFLLAGILYWLPHTATDPCLAAHFRSALSVPPLEVEVRTMPERPEREIVHTRARSARDVRTGGPAAGSAGPLRSDRETNLERIYRVYIYIIYIYIIIYI